MKDIPNDREFKALHIQHTKYEHVLKLFHQIEYNEKKVKPSLQYLSFTAIFERKFITFNA